MKVLDVSAALVLSGAAAFGLSTMPAHAQVPAANAAAAPADAAKPSAYEGVSQPPAGDVITATEAAPAVQPVVPAPPPAAATAPAAAAAPSCSN